MLEKAWVLGAGVEVGGTVGTSVAVGCWATSAAAVGRSGSDWLAQEVETISVSSSPVNVTTILTGSLSDRII